MIPPKMLETCHHCHQPCKTEVYRLSHRYAGEDEDIVMPFCSVECWQEHFELVPHDTAERQYREEAQVLWDQVCWPCRWRLAKHT
jgi:hypothetical protein